MPRTAAPMPAGTPPKVDGRSREARAARANADAPKSRAMDIDPMDGPTVARGAVNRDLEAPTRAGVQPVRANTRVPTRQTQPREPARDLPRTKAPRGAVVAEGRDGEVLTRRRTTVGDIYHVPAEEIPEGWDYQWNTYTVLNEQATDHQVMMHTNGFRAVPASRHPGRWTHPGEKGGIIVNGMRLEERPSSLGDEARAEDKLKARTQLRDQTDSLRLTQKLPSGMEVGKKYRGTGADVRMSIDKNLDIPIPGHQLLGDGEE